MSDLILQSWNKDVSALQWLIRRYFGGVLDLVDVDCQRITDWKYPRKGVFYSCRVHTNRTRGIYPGYYPTKELLWVLQGIHTRTRNFWKFCMAISPYKEHLSVLYVRATMPGVRVQQFHTYLPGTSVSWVRPCHNTRNFCEFCNSFLEFCNTSVPVRGTSASSVRTPYPYPELLWLLKDCGTIPGVRVLSLSQYPSVGTDYGRGRCNVNAIHNDVMCICRRPMSLMRTHNS